MKNVYCYLITIFIGCCAWMNSAANVYVIIYATIHGRTGHSGIAIDNYYVVNNNGRTDTIPDGTITYYDLWPGEDDFQFMKFSKDRAALYYKLPNSIWPSTLTVTTLFDKGIPHREYYPPDALLQIHTKPGSDKRLIDFLDTLLKRNRPFNARHYNCSDFVKEALATILEKPLYASEFVPFGFSTTPNKLCRKLMKMSQVSVIKSPGDRVCGNFLQERVFRRKPAPAWMEFQ